MKKVIIDNPHLNFGRVPQFKIVTSKTYNALSEVQTNCIYFLIDTLEIYKGGLCFSNTVVRCRSLPSEPARGKFYYNLDTKQLLFYDTDLEEWVSFSTPIVNSLLNDNIDYSTVTITGKGIKEYIDKKIQKDNNIFDTYEAAKEYAESELAIPGQCITAPSTKNEEDISLYVVQKDGSIKEYPSLEQIEKLIDFKLK